MRQSLERDITSFIELWKAIHGGCWPGPPLDSQLNLATQEVIAGLALHNLSHAFADKAMAQEVQKLAAQSLESALPALQRAVKG